MAWSMSTNQNDPWSLAIFFSIGRYPRPSPSGLSYFKKFTTSWDLFFPLLAFAEIQFQTTEQEGCRRGPFCPSFSALPTMLTITSETFKSEETSSLALKLQLPYQDFQADCSADAHKFKKIVEKDLSICDYRSSLSFKSEIASRHLQSQQLPFLPS